MRHIKWTAPRIAVGIALSLTVSAFAFFAATILNDSEASHTAKSGAAEVIHKPLPMTVTFPEGVTPAMAAGVPLTMTVANNTEKAASLAGPEISISVPSDPICASWLEVWGETQTGEESAPFAERAAGTNTTDPLKPIPANSAATDVLTYFPSVKQLYLRFKPSLVAGTDQTQCAGQPIQVAAKLTTPH